MPVKIIFFLLGFFRNFSQKYVAITTPNAAAMSVVTNLPCARKVGENENNVKAINANLLPANCFVQKNMNSPKNIKSKIIGRRAKNIILSAGLSELNKN